MQMTAAGAAGNLYFPVCLHNCRKCFLQDGVQIPRRGLHCFRCFGGKCHGALDLVLLKR